MNVHHKINYIEFAAHDLDRAKAFYSQAFGWSFQDHGPDYCAFHDGHLDGGFYRANAASSAVRGAALVVLYSEALEATASSIRALGGSIVKDIFDFPGGRRFHFTDPHGNELAVWSDH